MFWYLLPYQQRKNKPTGKCAWCIVNIWYCRPSAGIFWSLLVLWVGGGWFAPRTSVATPLSSSTFPSRLYISTIFGIGISLVRSLAPSSVSWLLTSEGACVAFSLVGGEFWFCMFVTCFFGHHQIRTFTFNGFVKRFGCIWEFKWSVNFFWTHRSLGLDDLFRGAENIM